MKTNRYIFIAIVSLIFTHSIFGESPTVQKSRNIPLDDDKVLIQEISVFLGSDCMSLFETIKVDIHYQQPKNPIYRRARFAYTSIPDIVSNWHVIARKFADWSAIAKRENPSPFEKEIGRLGAFPVIFSWCKSRISDEKYACLTLTEEQLPKNLSRIEITDRDIADWTMLINQLPELKTELDSKMAQKSTEDSAKERLLKELK